jgi:hypothetical protein
VNLPRSFDFPMTTVTKNSNFDDREKHRKIWVLFETMQELPECLLKPRSIFLRLAKIGQQESYFQRDERKGWTAISGSRSQSALSFKKLDVFKRLNVKTACFDVGIS